MDIICKSISKSFGDLPVLRNLSFCFPEGKTSAIMGPSGCGKTTLLHLLLGLYKVDSGEILGLEGKQPAVVFQEDRLCDTLDAETNLRLVTGKRYGKTELREHFRQIGLTDYEGKPVSELSGGMKRRVAILRAVLAESDFVVLDEPFQGLNKELKESVIEYVRKQTTGKTVVLVTHDSSELIGMGIGKENLCTLH